MTHPLFSINDFFEGYANAVASFNSKSVAFCYDVPCSFLSDEHHTVFMDATQLEGFFSKGVSFYKQHGVTQVIPEVRNKWLWTEQIANVKMIWHYFNDTTLLYSCDYQYLLRTTEDGDWKIASAISINEKQRMEEWLAKTKK